jgi:hypothetical protein
MAETESRFRVPLSELDAVHVPLDEQVIEEDTTPPVPDLKDSEDRDRETVFRNAAL